jgi:hypothetical protein
MAMVGGRQFFGGKVRGLASSGQATWLNPVEAGGLSLPKAVEKLRTDVAAPDLATI